MALNATASNLIVIWYILASVLNLGAVVGLAFLLSRVQSELSRLTTKVEPLLSKADGVLGQANEHLDRIGTQATNIMNHTEGIATTVETKTDQVSSNVSRMIYAPFISVSALVNGITYGVKTFSTLRSVEGRTKQKGRIV